VDGGEIDVYEFEKKIRNLICPFCGSKEAAPSKLIQHVIKHHPLTKCPACGFKGKDMVMHFAKRRDRAHELLWALYGSAGKGGHRRPRRLIEIRRELWG